MKPISEQIFESYLSSQSLAWEYEPALGRKRPDYLVHHSAGDCLLEVEELTEPKPRPSGGFSPVPAIRNAMRRARNQLREYKSLPTGIVLYSESVSRWVTPQTVAAAAFGPGFNDARDYNRLDPGPPAFRFARRAELPPHLAALGNPFLSRDANRSISALIVLMHYQIADFHLEIWQRLYHRQASGDTLAPGESMRLISQLQHVLPNTFRFTGTIRVVVMENPHARIPFPNGVFCGPFDQRWSLEEGWYTPTWIGTDLVTLSEQGVPFDFL